MIGLLAITILSLLRCSSPSDEKLNAGTIPRTSNSDATITVPLKKYTGITGYFPVTHDVTIGDYFRYMDSIVHETDTNSGWKINEYTIVHFNPWIIDTLQESDYYRQKKKGVFQYDQSEKIVLHKNDSLAIPDSIQATRIFHQLSSTVLDVNIPEYTLRIIQQTDTVLKTKVRVGRNGKKYLPTIGHEVDLRTPIGTGEIIRIEKNPTTIDLETGEPYVGTYRDDGKFTKMPVVPWLEPSINGFRFGAMIHPTTNPKTLGRAYSHGCIGTSEADAWIIYYHAPPGTKVNFRYDLKMINSNGDTILLKDIYQLNQKKIP